MKVMEVSARQQLQLENRRKEVRAYLENFDTSELLEIEARYAKRTKWDVIDRLMSGDDTEIAKIHKGEALDSEPFDGDEK